jgi:tetratricopeptide (TPR) repeat protein
MATDVEIKETLKDISFLIGSFSGMLRETVVDVMRESGCLKILQTEDEKDVLKLLNREHHSRTFFLILDLDEEHFDGLQVAKDVRADNKFQNLPVLVLISNITPEQVGKAGEIGVSGFLLKPFPPNALVRKIHSIVQARNNPPDHVKLLLQGEVAAKAGRIDEALGLFQKSRELNNSARITVNIGITFELKKMYEEAHHKYDEAAEINPQFLKAYVVAADLMVKIGKHNDAIPYLEKALEISPNSPKRQILKAKIHLKTGDLKEAMKSFDKAIKLDRHNCIDVSEALISSGHAEKAEEILRTYLDADENHSATYNKLGIALRRQGKWQQAVVEYRKAIDIYKKDEALYFNMGKAFIEGGNRERARDCFLRALDLNPRFPQALTEIKKLN